MTQSSNAFFDTAADLQKQWAQTISNLSGIMSGENADLGLFASEPVDEKEEHKGSNAHHFYESWLKTYESTVGRFVNMATVGPARCEFEKLNKSTDTYMKYQAATSDFSGKMLRTGMEAFLEVMGEAADLFSDEITEEDFDKFHHLLLKVGERRYHELFSSPLFCQSLESFINTGLDWRKAWSDMTEEALKTTPVVTQSQADEIHKEIYSLRKRLLELERKTPEKSMNKQGDENGDC